MEVRPDDYERYDLLRHEIGRQLADFVVVNSGGQPSRDDLMRLTTQFVVNYLAGLTLAVERIDCTDQTESEEA